MGRLALFLLAALCLSGCGYGLSGRNESLPDGLGNVYVELFANRTAEPFVENLVTDRVVEEFARRGRPPVTEDRANAQAVLSGTVLSYSSTPISYDRNDNILEYRSLMKLSAALRRGSDGKYLWKGNVSWSEEYPASDDKAVQEDNEAAAIEVVAERLAEELYFRVVDNF